jgi:signal transduction histidine kinase
MTAEIRRRRSELLVVNAELRQSEELYRNLAQSLEVRVEESTREIKQLYQQAATRSQELEVLYQADEQLYRYLRVDDVLQALVDVVIDRLGADKSSVMVWDEGTRRLGIRAARGFSPETLARLNDYQPGEGLAGSVYHSGQVITIEDAASAPHPANQIAAVEGIRSVISVPIIIKNHTFGVFGMHYCQSRRFSPEDIRLFQALAQRAAIAIENARLYEQAEQAAITAERSRLARELHDAVTQTLFSANLIADVIPRIWRRNPEEGMQNLEELRQLTRGALAEMRTLLLEMRPESLERPDLKSLLTQLSEAFIGRVRIPIDLQIHGECMLSREVKIVFYRVAQEALNNIAKHSGARQVELHLDCQPDHLKLCIQDDGLGFDTGSIPPNHLGIAIMRERANSIGASLNIQSQLGLGTKIEMDWEIARMD